MTLSIILATSGAGERRRRVSELTDYCNMSGGDLLTALGDDAAKWAAAFCQINGTAVPEDIMLTWFANAIEHSHDVRTGGGPVVLPDGSAFFIGIVGGE